MKNKYKITFVVLLSFFFLLISCGKNDNLENTTHSSVEAVSSTSTSTSSKASTSTSISSKASSSKETSTTVVKCNVTFKIDFVTYTLVYNKGDKIEKPADSTREGYRNDGWFYNDHKWDFDNDVVEGNMLLQAKFTKLCTVTFNYDNGTADVEEILDQNSLITKPTDPTMEGYSFDGWYHDDTLWNFDNDKITDNITLKAKWTKLALTCSISANDSSKGSVSGASTSTYDYNSSITIEATPNDGYKFVHWIDATDNSIVSTDIKFTFNIKSNVNYIAIFEDDEKVNYKVNYYLQNILDNDYTLNTDLSYTAQAPRNSYLNLNSIQIEGFTIPSSKRKQIMPDGSTTFDFYYDRLTFDVYLSTDHDQGAGSYEGDETYKYGETVTITAISAARDISFIGWYKDSLFISDDNPYTFEMPAENVVLTAMFKQTKFRLTYESLIPGIRVQPYKNANFTEVNMLFDEYIEPGTTIGFLGLSGDRTAGQSLDWIVNGEKYTGYNYTLTMPEKDIHIIIQTDKTYFTNGYNYWFGSYPQKQVINTTLMNKLDAIAGLPSTNDNWVSYGYYELSEVSDYMYYIDIDIDNNGILDYRGVYFTRYRPYRTQGIIDSNDEFDLKYTYQDDHNFKTNEVYWFSYDLITWWKNDDYGNDSVELYTLLTLDAQDFNHYYQISNDEIPYEHNGGEGFSNSYLLSDLRKWLNTTFYQTAFSSEQKKLINATAIQTNGHTVNDYVYIFSKDDAPTNGEQTDYATCQGAHNKQTWTSTPTEYAKQAYINPTNYYASGYAYVSEIYGIRPVITLKIN